MRESKPWYLSRGVWGGIVATLAPVIGYVIARMTGDEQAGVLVLGALTSIGGIIAVGGRALATRRIAKALTIIAAIVALGACGPSVRTPTLRAKTAANTASYSDGVEQWDSTIYGITPTFVGADRDGLAKQSGSLSRTMTLSLGEQPVLTIDDPLDGSLRGFHARIMPDGQTVIDLEAFDSTPSATIAAMNEQVIRALAAQEVITEAQAAAVREAVRAGATLGEAILRVLASPVP